MPRPTSPRRVLTFYGRAWPLLVIIAICLFALPIAALRKTHATESARGGNSKPPLARLGDKITAKATNNANPEVHLSNGREILTTYNGPEKLRTALEQNQATP